MSMTAASFDEYEFDRGDHVRGDWTDGNSPLDEVVGTVSRSLRSGGNVVIAVEVDGDQYLENSIYGGIHDAAPAWVKPIDQS